MSNITVISPELQKKYFKQESYIYHTVDLEGEIVVNRDLPIKLFPDYGFVASLPNNSIVAGGYVLGLLRGNAKDIGDIDIYSKSEDMFLELQELLFKQGYIKKPIPSGILVFADTFSKPGHFDVQLIRTLWFDSPEHVIDTFDFTVCQFAIQNGFLIFNPMGVFDATRKELIINRLNFPNTMLKRIVKYEGKGFTITDKNRNKVDEAVKNAKENPGIEYQLFPLNSAY